MKSASFRAGAIKTYCGSVFISMRQLNQLGELFLYRAISEARARASNGSLYGAGRLLHQGIVMKNAHLQELWQMQPVVPAFDLCLEQHSVVPGIHGKPREKEPVAVFASAAQDSRNAIFKTDIFQQIFQETCEVLVFLRKAEGIRKRIHGSANILFNYFLRMS